jgi:hypothetical protein
MIISGAVNDSSRSNDTVLFLQDLLFFAPEYIRSKGLDIPSFTVNVNGDFHFGSNFIVHEIVVLLRFNNKGLESPLGTCCSRNAAEF